jgi:hypothetical protein
MLKHWNKSGQARKNISSDIALKCFKNYKASMPVIPFPVDEKK